MEGVRSADPASSRFPRRRMGKENPLLIVCFHSLDRDLALRRSSAAGFSTLSSEDFPTGCLSKEACPSASFKFKTAFFFPDRPLHQASASGRRTISRTRRRRKANPKESTFIFFRDEITREFNKKRDRRQSLVWCWEGFGSVFYTLLSSTERRRREDGAAQPLYALVLFSLEAASGFVEKNGASVSFGRNHICILLWGSCRS